MSTIANLESCWTEQPLSGFVADRSFLALEFAWSPTSHNPKQAGINTINKGDYYWTHQQLIDSSLAIEELAEVLHDTPSFFPSTRLFGTGTRSEGLNSPDYNHNITDTSTVTT